MAGIDYQILEVLEEQLECYDGLYTLAEYKSRAIIDKDIDFLKEVVAKEEEFVARVSFLDKKRDTLFRDISQVTGLKYNELTITKLIEKMDPALEISKDLVSVREKLLKVIESVRKKNEQNKVLISQSLDFVEFTLNAIQTTRLSSIEVNYTKPGYQNGVEHIRAFDAKK